MAGVQRERAVRSDSTRNRDAILHAAAECLSVNPSASLADIAQAAGIARITLYGHFSSRNELLTELVHTSMARVEAELASVDLSGDTWHALEALVASSWRLVSSLSVLRGVAEQALPADEMHGSHGDPRTRVEHTLARGRTDGSFRDDQSIAWQTACYFSLLHGAAAEVRAGRLGEDEVQESLIQTLRALLQAPSAQ
ncbi:TetR/AcrR family transcriptional regulator [uncultured Microbacterium sp.]|uniref:Putative TetR-family transcriptional regulator n=1 Tax=uncultured Microbacterium sp. TaxID=191216 RepID=A0A1Y5P3A6_9MICO|nr:TetR/AcrR family transcriptional regulator [uncultured Microbacterium sp.]SBS73196.1 putative TetR-family transcriptional regulator [uncultured Microbacterium sp.]